MNSLRVFFSRVRSLFEWQRRERDLDEEVRFHLEKQIEENVRRGMTSEEAEYAARRSFGGVSQMRETYRDHAQLVIFDHLWRDLRFAERMLHKSPGFSATAILTIALGIGINASVFTLLNAIALRPLALPESDRLVGIYQTFQGKFPRNVYGNDSLFSYPEYLQYRDQNHVFTGVIAYSHMLRVSVAGLREKLGGALTTCNYFEVLQSLPAHGRGFLPEECAAAGKASVIVLSDDAWRNFFSSDPAIVGKIIRLNQQPMMVVGVAAPGFRGTELIAPAFWTPLVNANLGVRGSPGEHAPLFLTDENLSWLSMIGRLHADTSLAQARAELKVIAAQIDQRQPGRTTRLDVDVANLMGLPEERTIGLAIGVVILCAVGLVLLIGCANLTNLMLARAVARRREIAVRLALGAGRAQLIRQLLTESLLLSFLGGVLGTVVAVSSSRALLTTIIAHLPPDTPQMALTLTPDIRVFGYCLALMFGTGLMFGLAPALQATRSDVRSALNQESGFESRRGERGRLRGALIGAQVAICVLLLICAGLLLHGLYRGERLDTGFDIDNVAAIRLNLEDNGYTPAQAAEFRTRLIERIKTFPGVTGAAEAAITPLSGAHNKEEFTTDSGSSKPLAEVNWISPEYLGVVGIPIARGRNFSDAEERSGAPLAIVTEATARSFWPGENAIGKHLRRGSELIEIIGVTRNTRTGYYTEVDNPYIYLPLSPKQAERNIVVRFTGSYPATADAIRAAVRELDPNVLAGVTRIKDNLVTWIAPARVSVALAAVLGGLAFVLAVIGIYGTVAYMVSRRVREISIRMMLGARAADVLRLMLKQAMRPVIVGAVLGAALSIAAARLVTALLFGLHLFDAISFGPVVVFLMLTALIATYLPTRRAVRVDPMQALRQQ